MAFEPFKKLTARTVVLPQSDIDTDQIIPARFLTTTSREGLGKAAFYDWRYDGEGGALPDSPLNNVDVSTHKILVAGANFACGSSREHAPWALLDYGFRAVISSDIADIFTSNALKNGLLTVVVPPDAHQYLLTHQGAQVSIDLEENTVTFCDHQTTFTVEPFARRCLLDGVDPLGHLLNQVEAITAYEARRREVS